MEAMRAVIGWRKVMAAGLVCVAWGLAGCMESGAPAGAGRQLSAGETRGMRTRKLLDTGWRFVKGDPEGNSVSLLYDVRPAGRGGAAAGGGAGAAPATMPAVVKQWVLPSGNAFVKEEWKRAVRPEGGALEDVAYAMTGFDDRGWKQVEVPHDYAIEGPFIKTGGGGMGRLPTSGVVWYRRELEVSKGAECVFLDFDGAMSYSEVWVNGKFAGGWPYGYSSFRLDVTKYINRGGKNVVAVRLDNPPNSSRWYPGGGLYRNVWQVETSAVHVGQWGTFVTTPEITPDQAQVSVKVTVENEGTTEAQVRVGTEFFEIDDKDQRVGGPVARLEWERAGVAAGKKGELTGATTIMRPKLWGVAPRGKPARYVAVTSVWEQGDGGRIVDDYETVFGIRSLKFDANEGFFLNGQRVQIQGVCDHHDLGALGAAVNVRALERQLQMLQEMGCNAIRCSHNPPAPELLDLCDRMGFLVMDEAFDCWARQKTALDYHLLWADWHEQDLRAMLRRDRNHPSVIMWSIGNEVGEQFGGTDGPVIAKELVAICHDEDPTRQTISAMNAASANSPFPAPIEMVGLNYQGTGVRNGPPQYPVFHAKFPEKFILGSETEATVSSRGVYTFPVAPGLGVPASPRAGEDAANRQVSSYDLYFASWSYSPEKEFASMEKWPFVGGEFVWTGFDYLGEPTPFDQSRSSYFGIIDLAGFKKDRFYLYQSVWRPELPMAHILPHWTWPERPGQVTPVHVYTSGDEAELFINGKSQGKKKKEQYQYRLRWDEVVYEPGEVKVVAYKNGKEWATDAVRTAGDAKKLVVVPDRVVVRGDGKDLVFVTVKVCDGEGRMAPRAMNGVRFEVEGAGELVATDNGDPTDFTAFGSGERKAFNGFALGIVKPRRGGKGEIVVKARSEGLEEGVGRVRVE